MDAIFCCFYSLLTVVDIREWCFVVYSVLCYPIFFLYHYIVHLIPLWISLILCHINHYLFFRSLGKSKVVVIGGGFLGSSVVQLLQDCPNIEITLIDKSSMFYYTPGFPRISVDPFHKRVIQSSHMNYINPKKTTFVQDEVNYITKEYITVQNNYSIPYDYLVIATGASYQVPEGLSKSNNLFRADNAEEMYRSVERLERARTVLIIGGGITGVELTCEIVSKYPDVSVILVHSGDRLIPSITLTNHPREYINQVFSRYNVTVILNNKVLYETQDSVFMTDKNRTVHADIAYFCCSGKPNNSLCKYISNNEDGIMVNQFLQVKGFYNVFAAGDVVTKIGTESDQKLAQNAEIQAETVVNNILTLQHTTTLKTLPKLESYSPADRIMIISLGKYDAILVWKWFSITGIIPALLKDTVERKTMCRYWKSRLCKDSPLYNTKIEV